MKKLLILSVALLTWGFTSCGNSTPQTDVVAEDSSVVAIDQALSVEEVLEQADSLIKKEVTIRGVLTHICKHSGRHGFMVGQNDSTVTMRIDAKGNIGGFNRELNGSEVAVKGILHEGKLTQEAIDQMEAELQKSKEAGTEACESDLQNIRNMRNWMKAHDRDTYAIFYLEGQEYEVIE